MPTPVRVGSTHGMPPGQSPQTYQNTFSGYGSTRSDSVGYSPQNPYGHMATVNAKAYPSKAPK